NVLAFARGEVMHLDHAASAHRIDMSLERDHAAPVRLTLTGQRFQVAEQPLRELRSALARRHSDFDLSPAAAPEPAARRENDRKRQIFIARNPQTVLKASNRN